MASKQLDAFYKRATYMRQILAVPVLAGALREIAICRDDLAAGARASELPYAAEQCFDDWAADLADDALAALEKL